MFSRACFTFCAAALSLFLAMGGSAQASNANKTVHGNGGNANQNTTYVDPNTGTTATSTPTATDVVAITATDQTVTLTDPVTTWGGLDFSNGSLKGNKKLTLSLTGSVWTGGIIDGSTLSTPDITIGSGSEKKIQGGGQLEVLAGGTATWTGDDIIAGGTGTSINNSGTFKATSNGKISQAAGDTAGTFTNAGTFEKSTVGTSTEIDAIFNSTGTASAINVTGGSLKLKGGGESSKAVTLANNTILEVSTTDFTFSGGTLNATGSGEIDVTSNIATFVGTTGSANLNISGTGTAKVNGSHSTTGRLKLSSGKLDATNTTDTTTVGGFDWSGGDVAKGLVTSGDTTISGVGTKNIYGGAKLTLNTATTWSDGNISTDGGAEINTSGTFTISATGNTAITKGSGGGTFKNGGSLVKGAASTGITEIGATFDNTTAGASVTVNAGTLKLTGGGSSNKGVSLATGSKLEIGANYNFTGGTLDATGTGAIEINTAGVTASFSGTSGSANLTVSAGTASFDGTHTGSGKLTVSGGTVSGGSQAQVGSLDFSAGNLNGRVRSAGATTISNSNKSINGGELTLGGTTDLAGGTLTLSNGGKINNEAGKSFRVNGDATLANGGGSGIATFTNDGSFDKLDGTGTTTVGTVFNTSTGGSVSVAANKGALKLSGGGKTSGSVSIGSGAKLQVDSADYSFDGATLGGAGTVELVGATTTFKGVGGTGKVSVNGGNATFDTSSSAASQLSLANGTLSSTNGGSLSVGALDFSGGNLNGKVTTTGATTISSTGKAINGGDLTLGGTTDLAGGILTLSNGGKIKNNAGISFRVNGDATLSNGGGAGVATFTNDGSFEKLDGTGTTTVGTVFDTSAGGAVTVAANKGALKLSGGGKTSGNVSVGDGAKLQVDSANYSFDGATLGGTGTVELVGATTTFKGVGGTAKVSLNGGNATFDTSSSTAAQLSLANGTLSSTNGGSLNVGALDFSGGNLNGKVTTSGATNISNSNKTIDGGDLTLGGATDLAGGILTLSNGGKIKNNAGISFRVNGDATLANGGGAGVATFTNDGSFEKLDGTGTTTVNTAFNTSTGGSVKVAANKGTLKLNGGGTTSGSLDIGTGAKLEIGGSYTFDNATHTGGGQIDLTGGTTTFKTTTGSAKLHVGGGTASFDTGVSTASELTLDSGTINGAGSAEVGALNFNGGNLNGKVKSTGATTISNSGKTIDGGELTLAGTAGTDFAGGILTLSNGGKIKNNAGISFRVNADGTLANGGGAGVATFTNDGSFAKADGNGTTTVGTVFDTSSGGSVSIAANKGTLKLGGGGKTSGSVSVGDGAKLQVDSANYSFDGATLGGTGTVELVGATTTFKGVGGNGKVSVNGGNATFDTSSSTASQLSLANGTLSSTNGGSVSVGALDFSGGNLNGKVTTTGATNISNSNKTIDGGDLTLGGATDLAGGILTLSNGGKIKNNAGISFRVNGDATLANGGGAGVATFTNDGSFEKLDGTGTTTVGTTFNTSTGGSVKVAANKGTLKFAGGGTTSGGIDLGAGTKLEIGSNAYTFDNATTTGSGTIDLTSATTTFKTTTGSAKLHLGGGTATFDTGVSTASELTLDSGTINGAGSAEVGALNFNGGNLNGKVKSTGATSISNTGKTIDGGELTLAGAAGTDFAGGILTLTNGGKIKNEAGKSFRVNADGTLANGGGAGVATFTNDGSFEKADGTGATIVSTEFDTSSGGAIKIAANKGTLKLNGGGTTSGSLDIGAGAKLEIGSSYTFDNATHTGGGQIDLTGGTTTFKTTTGSAKLHIGGATATFDTGVSTTGELTFDSGTINGGGNAEVDALVFNGGNLNGKVKSKGATSISSAGKTIDGGELTLSGDAGTDFAGGVLTLTNGGKIKNEAGKAFRANADGTVANGGGAGIATFTNDGIFEKTSGGAASTEIQAEFDSTGEIKASNGKIKLSGGGTASGTVTVADNGTIEIAGKDYTFQNVTRGGNGDLQLTGANTTFKNSTGSGKISVKGGNAKFDDSASSTTGLLSLESGTVTTGNGGSLEVGTLDWKGGSLNGKVKSNGNASITGNGKFISGGDLTLAGTTTWDGTSITTGNGARLTNDTNGIFNVTDGQISYDGTGTRGKFTNAGQLKKNSGTGDTIISTDFDNSGSLEITTGKLKLSNVIKNLAKGKIDVSGTGELDLNGDVELAATSELKGNGRAKFQTGTLLASTLIDILNFDFEGGSLAGTNTFSGIVSWTGGDWSVGTGNDTTTVASGAILNLTKANGHDFNRRSIHNLGVVNWNGGNLRSGNGGVFINDSIFNDLNAGARSIESPGNSGFGGTFSFTNNGTYKKTNGGTTTVEIDFINNGGIEIASGSVIFTGTFTNNGSVNFKAGASAKFTTTADAPLKFGKDTPLSGTGTVDAAFVQAEGLVSPGNSPGTLTLTGSLTLLNTSQLLIELSGKTQGTDYDFLNVGGSAALSGNLSLSLLNGFGPGILPTDTFTILTATNGLTGIFSNVADGGRLYVGVGTGSFQVNYGANSVTLSDFSAIPEPSTWALMGLGAAAVLFQTWRRRRTS